MNHTCNISERPFGANLQTWIDRLAPEDPLFDKKEEEAPENERAWPRRRRTVRTTAGRALALAAALLAQACGGPEARPAEVADAILVQLAGDAAPAHLRRDPGGAPIAALETVGPADEAPLLRVPVPAGMDPAEFAHETAQQEAVAFAEPIYLYSLSKTPNDPRFKDLWGLSKIEAEKAWSATVGDRKVAVAVVDNGVALDHPDLKANLWVNPEAAPDRSGGGDGDAGDVHGYDFVDNKPDPSPAKEGAERWHGTHVAGIIGAVGDNRIGVVGVNWKVSLMALRAIGPQGGRTDDLARAIDYATDRGARVINASWGGSGTSQVIARAIARAARHGVLFVAAAGNDGGEKPGFPANLTSDAVISVGATTPDDLLAPFSNRGALVAAPGVGILSTTAPGQYERYDGTSMATPHVSGLAALLWAAQPKATLAQVRKAIFASGAAVQGARHGRIDAARALAALTHGGATPAPGGALHLSRSSLTFQARKGRAPRAQTLSLRTQGGGARHFTAKTDASWVRLSKESGTTPARITVRVDPARLSKGEHTAHVTFVDAESRADSAQLEVKLRSGEGAAVAVAGGRCELRDGRLHVQAGATCSLAVPGTGVGASASEVEWRLPGGARVFGARFFGEFTVRGEYRIEVGASEGATDELPVVVE